MQGTVAGLSSGAMAAYISCPAEVNSVPSSMLVIKFRLNECTGITCQDVQRQNITS